MPILTIVSTDFVGWDQRSVGENPYIQLQPGPNNRPQDREELKPAGVLPGGRRGPGGINH